MTEQQMTIEEMKQRLAALERQCHDQTALMNTLANSAYDALVVMNERHEILAMNESARTLFPHPEPFGQTLAIVTGSEDLDTMVTDAERNKEAVFEEQVSINHRIYRVRSQTTKHDDSYFVALGIQDITDLVRLNRARRDMVANISHELRTPIANIRLIIDSLFHEGDRPKRKKSIYSLRAIAKETDALLWMAEELLDLSMIESGQAIMRMVEVPVAEIVEEITENLDDLSQTKELDIVSDVSPDLLVLCDRDKIRRVLVNLVHNSIKWSPPGEVIMVRAEMNEDEVLISVLDNGPGVPEDQRERIFERFYQADASRSVSEGTGLGLAICKHIVEAHGGRIWAESNQQRRGGRFHFTLPRG